MTTPILFRKLAKLKLSKSAFETIRQQRVKNLQSKQEVVKCLKSILKKQVSKRTCRLCLTPGGNVLYKDNDEDDECKLVKVIKYVLDIEILRNDGKPQHICESCEDIVRAAAELKQTAEITQWRLQQELEMIKESSSQQSAKSAVDPTPQHGGYFNTSTGDVVREWSCKKCRRIFTKVEDFQQHEKQPLCRPAPRRYICETCGKETKSWANMREHRFLHTGELPFACSQCPYRGRTKCALKLHIRIHSGERPLTCPYCPATFNHQSNLNSHKRKHLPPTLQCDLCHKSFRFKAALEGHMITQHTDLRPHVCASCGRGFATKKQLRQHERKVHKRMKLRCGPTPVYLRQRE